MLLWIWVYKSLFETLLSILSATYPEVKLLDHMIILFLILWGTAILFFFFFNFLWWPFYIPTSDAQGFPFLHLFTTICYFLVFCLFLVLDSGHTSRYEVVSHCGFDLHFPNGLSPWISFHMPFGHLYIFFGQLSLPSGVCLAVAEQ